MYIKGIKDNYIVCIFHFLLIFIELFVDYMLHYSSHRVHSIKTPTARRKDSRLTWRWIRGAGSLPGTVLFELTSCQGSLCACMYHTFLVRISSHLTQQVSHLCTKNNPNKLTESMDRLAHNQLTYKSINQNKWIIRSVTIHVNQSIKHNQSINQSKSINESVSQLVIMINMLRINQSINPSNA